MYEVKGKSPKRLKSTLGSIGNAKTEDRECMPDKDYYKNLIKEIEQALDMNIYLLNMDMTDYQAGHASIGRLYVRLIDYKRSRKEQKRRAKQLAKVEKKIPKIKSRKRE